jgi:hypothetical protein
LVATSQVLPQSIQTLVTGQIAAFFGVTHRSHGFSIVNFDRKGQRLIGDHMLQKNSNGGAGGETHAV